MSHWIWDGDEFRERDNVPISDRGFRYGMSVFESIRVRNRTAFFLSEHLTRITSACEQCQFAVDKTALAKVGMLLEGAGIDGFARIYVTAGDGALTSGFDDVRILVFIEPREPIPSQVFHHGYDLGVEKTAHSPLFGGLKTGNYWGNVDAFRRGVARQKNETLLFNQRDQLISACMANVFLSFGKKLKTPSLACGTRNGVVREWILNRREAKECEITRADLENADEIFLTSSWLGIMPVASIEGRSLASKVFAGDLLAELER